MSGEILVFNWIFIKDKSCKVLNNIILNKHNRDPRDFTKSTLVSWTLASTVEERHLIQINTDGNSSLKHFIITENWIGVVFTINTRSYFSRLTLNKLYSFRKIEIEKFVSDKIPVILKSSESKIIQFLNNCISINKLQLEKIILSCKKIQSDIKFIDN